LLALLMAAVRDARASHERLLPFVFYLRDTAVSQKRSARETRTLRHRLPGHRIGTSPDLKSVGTRALSVRD
jgi:hypothetical protein